MTILDKERINKMSRLDVNHLMTHINMCVTAIADMNPSISYSSLNLDRIKKEDIKEVIYLLEKKNIRASKEIGIRKHIINELRIGSKEDLYEKMFRLENLLGIDFFIEIDGDKSCHSYKVIDRSRFVTKTDKQRDELEFILKIDNLDIESYWKYRNEKRQK